MGILVSVSINHVMRPSGTC